MLFKSFIWEFWEFLFCVVLTVPTECASNRMWSFWLGWSQTALNFWALASYQLCFVKRIIAAVQ